MRQRILIAVFLFFCAHTQTAIAQPEDKKIVSLGLWNLQSMYGEFRFGGMFQEGGMSSSNITDYVKSRSYFAGIQLNTSSYIWDPNFLVVGINGNYTPSTARSERLLFRNRYDNVNSRNLNMTTVLLPTKKFTLSSFLMLNDNFDSRENLTDLKTEGKSWGSNLSIKWKRLPMFFSYNNSTTQQQELSTIHKYNYNDANFMANASKSYSSRDKTELIYSNRTYCRQVDTGVSVINNLQTLQLRNLYFLDTNKTSRISSDIYYLRQCGVDSFDQFRWNEAFNTRLPRKVNFTTNYSMMFNQTPYQCYTQNQLNLMLGKQYFESLYLGVNGEYNKAVQTEYNEWFLNLGYNIVYNKRVFKKGYLSTSYSYNVLRNNHQSSDQTLNVINEAYILDDNSVVMIKLPYLVLTSLFVKDMSGTHIYIENVDYQLIAHGGYWEIKRIPGGQIAPNATVYLFYTANQPGNNQFDANQTNYSIDLSFFNRLIDVYYHNNCNDYCNLRNTEALFLNYFTNIVYGIKSDYKFLSLGAEYNDYQSNLYPYRLARAFATVQGKNSNRMVYALNLNYRYYYNIQNNENSSNQTDVSRTYYDANANLGYVMNYRTRFDVNAVYTYQHGQQIDLDLISGRIKMTKTLRSISIIASLDAYQRSYLNTQKYNSIGGNLQIVKKFKY